MAERKGGHAAEHKMAEVHVHHHHHHHHGEGPGKAAERKGGEHAARKETRKKGGEFRGERKKGRK